MLIGGGIAGRTGNNAARELSMEEISSYFESIKMTTIEEYKAGVNSSDPMYVVKFPKGQQYVAGSSSEALGLIFQMMQWEVNYKNAVIDSYFNGNNAVVPKSTNLSGSASPTVINPAETLPAVLGKGSTPIVPVNPTPISPINPTTVASVNPAPVSKKPTPIAPNVETANTYVSKIAEVNEIFAQIKSNNEREIKESAPNVWCPRIEIEDYQKLDEIIVEEISKNPEKRAEIIAYYKQMARDFDYDYNDIYFNSVESSESTIYRKAYEYTKTHGMEDAKIVILNPNCRNIYNAGEIINEEGLQNLNEWNIAVFDYNGEFLRYHSGKVSQPKYKIIDETVEFSTGSTKYTAETIKYMRKFNILIDSRKEVRDKSGNLLYVETYERKMATSKTKYGLGRYKYDIYREYPNGTKLKIGETTFFKNKDVMIEKTIPHDNGNVTNYVYLESKNGSKFTYTEIKDKEGNVILEHKHRFKVIDENHFRSIENGVGYNIEYTDTSIEVTRDDGIKVSIPLGDNSENGPDVLSKDLLPILKQLPGSMYFDISEFGLSKIALGIDDVEFSNAHYSSNKNLISISEEIKDHFYILIHELGHYRDAFLGISKNQEVVDIYTKERQTLTEKQSNFENNALNYFINVEGKNADRSLEEIIAEINALLYSSNQDDRIELRSQFLQEYFPETFAKVAELLTSDIANSTGIPNQGITISGKAANTKMGLVDSERTAKFDSRKQSALNLLYKSRQNWRYLNSGSITPKNIDVVEFVLKNENLKDNYQVLSMTKFIDSDIKRDFAIKFLNETNGKIENYDSSLGVLVQNVTTQEISDSYIAMTKYLLEQGLNKSTKGIFGSIVLSTTSMEDANAKNGAITILKRYLPNDNKKIYEIVNIFGAKNIELYNILKNLPKDKKFNDDVKKSMLRIAQDIEKHPERIDEDINKLAMFVYRASHINDMDMNQPATRPSKPRQTTINIDEIYKTVKNVLDEYSSLEEKFHEDMVKFGFSEIGEFKDRIKSEKSLFDKLKNYLEEHPGTKMEDAINDVRDAYACRTILKSQDLTNHPEVKALIEAGDTRAAILRAAEIQSQPAVDILKNIIQAHANGKTDYSITRLTNYVSEDGIPYFSERQLADLKQFAAERGIKISYIERIDENDDAFDEVDKTEYKPTTRAQISGYTAFQLNFTDKDGKIIEWQCRAEKVHEFAEGEHIAYDLRTGKDITAGDPGLYMLYDPVRQLLSNKAMPEKVYNSYTQYLTDYYTHLRKLELGFKSKEPQLTDYEVDGFKFNEKLSAKNLIKLSKIAKDFLNGKMIISEAIKAYECDMEKISAIKQDYMGKFNKETGKTEYLPEDIEYDHKTGRKLIQIPQSLKSILTKLPEGERLVEYNDGDYADINVLIQEWIDSSEVFELKERCYKALKADDKTKQEYSDISESIINLVIKNGRDLKYDMTLGSGFPINDILNEYLKTPEIYRIKDRIYSSKSDADVLAVPYVIPERIIELVRSNPKFAIHDYKAGAVINDIIADWLENPECFEIKSRVLKQTSNSKISGNLSDIGAVKASTNKPKNFSDADLKKLGIDRTAKNGEIPEDLKDFIARNSEDAKLDNVTGVSINDAIRAYLKSPNNFVLTDFLRETLLDQISSIDSEIAQIAKSIKLTDGEGREQVLEFEELTELKKLASKDKELAKYILTGPGIGKVRDENDNIIVTEIETHVFRELSEFLDKYTVKEAKTLILDWKLYPYKALEFMESYRKMLPTVDKELRKIINFDKQDPDFHLSFIDDKGYIVISNGIHNGDRFTCVEYKFDPKTGKLITTELSRKMLYNEKTKTISQTKSTLFDEVISLHDEGDYTVKLDGPVVTDLETLIYKNRGGKTCTHEEFLESEIPGEYEIYSYTPTGLTKTGIAEISPNGEKSIERTLFSLDDTKTEYVYHYDVKGNRFLYNKITDPSGKVLFEVKNTFKVIDENHFISSTNGQSYDIEFFENRVEITKLDKNNNKTSEKVVYRITDYSKYETPKEKELSKKIMRRIAKKMGVDLNDPNPENVQNVLNVVREFYKYRGLSKTLDKRLLPLLKQIPGEEWFNLDAADLQSMDYMYGNLFMEANAFAAGDVTVSVGRTMIDKLSVVEHEFGHIKFMKLKLYEDIELRKIYEAERANLIESFGSEFVDYLDYFVNDKTDNTGYRGLNETAAETNLIMNMHSQWNAIGIRTVLLQQYFPKTIAYIANKFNTENIKNAN